MIPKPDYPNSIDSNQNLFSVSDGLRVKLAEDYNPGDKSIKIFGGEEVIRSFSGTGIITLTEQCSEPELRALSFYYSSRTLNSFDNLELLPGFIDCPKPKKATNVTQNVMSLHHNNLKDALIKIERFAGKKDGVGKYPLKGTMEERINYLRRLVLSPRAWFRVDKVVGLSPLTVEFTNQSFYLGTDGAAYEVKHVWDFGDNTDLTNISVISVIDSVVPVNTDNVLVDVSCPRSGQCKVQKTYSKPGLYDVKLTVTNNFGLYELSDTVTFPKLINVRFPAPDTATIKILERGGQKLTPGIPGLPSLGGSGSVKPYSVSTPKIRAPINTLIEVGIAQELARPVPGSYTDEYGVNRTYSGEQIDSTGVIDKVDTYTWSFSDDLVHGNSANTKALFGVGGYFDLVLRADTEFNSYRITTYKNAFDIIENYNLWLWHTNGLASYSYEFGMISETFKIKGPNVATIIDSDFLDGSTKEEQLKHELLRNNGCSKRGGTPSGNGGTALLYWASGRKLADPLSSERVNFLEFNGFLESYAVRGNENPLLRTWNWVSLGLNQDLYFILGNESDGSTATSQQKTKYNVSDLSFSNSNLLVSNYKNGAIELLNNTIEFDYRGMAGSSAFSVYRSAWHEDSGYFMRNEGGAFYRISSFYKTGGNTGERFVDIKRLTDMPGSRVEGCLLSLSQGLYFFNNSGSVLAYGPNTGTWVSGGPGSTSASFRLLQDTTIMGFDDASKTLVGASDSDKIAYLSYDYSPKCFIKFNETEMSFKSVTNSPERETGVAQWQMHIF